MVTFFEGGHLNAECTNQITLLSSQEQGSKTEFKIEIKTSKEYTAVLYINNNGTLSELKRLNGRGSGVLVFSEEKLKEGRYRVTFDFNEDSKIICKTRSLEIE
jgi:hypothetical protein